MDDAVTHIALRKSDDVAQVVPTTAATRTAVALPTPVRDLRAGEH